MSRTSSPVENLAFLKQYIRTLAKVHVQGRPYYRYLLRYGRGFTKTIPCKGLVTRRVVKECYYNAQQAAVFNSKLHYYEGYAHTAIIPVEHAWVVYRGNVIDPTWEGRIKSPTAYFGIHIPTEAIESYWLKYREASNYLARWLVESGRISLGSRVHV